MKNFFLFLFFALLNSSVGFGQKAVFNTKEDVPDCQDCTINIYPVDKDVSDGYITLKYCVEGCNFFPTSITTVSSNDATGVFVDPCGVEITTGQTFTGEFPEKECINVKWYKPNACPDSATSITTLMNITPWPGCPSSSLCATTPICCKKIDVKEEMNGHNSFVLSLGVSCGCEIFTLSNGMSAFVYSFDNNIVTQYLYPDAPYAITNTSCVDANCPMKGLVKESEWLFSNAIIYPSMASDFIIANVYCEQSTLAKLQIFAASGHLVTQQTISPNTPNELNIAHLTPGIYIARIENSQGLVTTTKFVKQ